MREVSSFGPKHPVRDKYSKIHFHVDIESFLSELNLNRSVGEKLCEIEAAAKRYAKNVKHTPSDKCVEKARKFDKGMGYV